MKFARLSPHPSLTPLIECYWFMQSDDPKPRQEKIIPDGFPELIFHYGDAFRNNLNGTWEIQSSSLLAGQLSNYFWLENTGKVRIVAVKFKPAALTQLFGLNMSVFTDRVADLQEVAATGLPQLREKLLPFTSDEGIEGSAR